MDGVALCHDTRLWSNRHEIGAGFLLTQDGV